jgi:hypothetical protein
MTKHPTGSRYIIIVEVAGKAPSGIYKVNAIMCPIARPGIVEDVVPEIPGIPVGVTV